MKYSTGLTKKAFWFLESKKTAEYILKGLNKEEIIEIAIEKNIYQVESEDRIKTIANTCITRLNSLPKSLIECTLKTDLYTSKILFLIAVMKTDKLFFEFMYEVFRNKIILGDLTIGDKDLNIFFNEKMLQSETVNNWKESNIKRLKKEYIRLLFDAGILENNNDIKKIIIPIIDFRVEENLISNKLNIFLYILNGVK
ncbi:MAG: DUF1819 family protein [Methanobrevibacter sp.]|jgi:hypothetical protein|nr:DUF1819 family protein [Candidatus Methanovirga meridionalis]